MGSEQANSNGAAVTSGSTSAERMRRKRQRDQQLTYARQDWKLFIDPTTISQKAGCHAHEIGKIVLKELVDNALDIGARVELRQEGETWIISDERAGAECKGGAAIFCS
jgi:hypothetical protein